MLQIVTDRREDLESRFAKLLELGCERLGFELGIISQIAGGVYRVRAVRAPDDLPVEIGAEFPIADTFCCETVCADKAIGFGRPEGSRWERHPAIENFGLRSYVGAAIRVGGEVIGTVNFSARTELGREPNAEELVFVNRLADWVGGELERCADIDHLKEMTGRLGSVLKTSVDGIMIFDAVRSESGLIEDFRWTSVNPAAARLVGRSAEQLNGQRMLETLPGNRSDGLFLKYVRVVESGIPIAFEHRYNHDGISAVFRISARKLGDGFVVSFADVSNLHRAIGEANEARDEVQMILDSVPAMIWFKDPSGRVIRANAAVARAMGLPLESIEGRTTEELHPGEAAKYVADDQEVLASRKPKTGIVEEVFVGPADRRWVSTDKIPILNAKGEASRLLVVASDITRLKQTEDSLRKLAEEDQLTGLANRATFNRAGEAMFNRTRSAGSDDGEHFALLMLDFDRFKSINDTLGHAAGDELLRSIAGRLRGAVKQSDVVARLGGDEFGILLTGLTDEKQSVEIADRIRRRCARAHSVAGHNLTSTASIGLATSLLEYQCWDTMVDAADQASLEAKSEGRNRVVVSGQEAIDAAARRTGAKSRILETIDQGRIGFMYQPMVRVDTGEVVGAELLCRWPDDELSTIELFELANEAGLVHCLTEVVAREAMRLACEPWMSGRIASFNLGRAEVLNPSTPELIAEALSDEFRQRPDARSMEEPRVMVEISERVCSDPRSDVRPAIAALREAGLRVAVEDFGAGSTAIRQVRELEIDLLKIDRALISEGATERSLMSVLQALRSLASDLGLEVAAEGIETADQLAVVSALDISMCQGFHIARPLTRDDLRAFTHRSMRDAA